MRPAPFEGQILAGFECGRIEWTGNRCLATAVGHLVGVNLESHYDLVARFGVKRIRDGLQPWLGFTDRIAAARAAGLDVIWDLNHYWRHQNAGFYAHNVGNALRAAAGPDPVWVCFNELSFHPVMCPGESFEYVLEQSRRILEIVRGYVDARLVTSEPAHSVAEMWFNQQRLEVLKPDVIGLNIYAHCLLDPIEKIVETARSRFEVPVMISETGLHVDHPTKWRGINSKHDWLHYVRAAAPKMDVCWYPIVNMVDWDGTSVVRHDHGLIGGDLSVDLSLSAAIHGVMIGNGF